MGKHMQTFMQPFNWINPHSVIVIDNASIHHVEQVVDMIEDQLGARLLFLTPYSPDVEEVFSKIRAIMKENDALFQACNDEKTRALLMMAFGMVIREDCITHNGYQ